MSYVTDVVVYGYVPKEVAELLVQPIAGDSREQSLRRLDLDAAGGNKYMIGDIYAGGINYLPADEFEKWICGLPWHQPHDSFSVIVLLHTEGLPAEAYRITPTGLVELSRDDGLRMTFSWWQEPSWTAG